MTVQNVCHTTFLHFQFKTSCHNTINRKTFRPILVNLHCNKRQFPRSFTVYGCSKESRDEGEKETIKSLSDSSHSISEDNLTETSTQPGTTSVQIPLDLPRRRVEVSFTCNRCEFRTSRLVNPLALAKGTVFVQCASCEVYHQLIDNLGLIVEYNYKEEDRLEELYRNAQSLDEKDSS